MNVVILSDHDSQGGAAVATSRIEAGLALIAKRPVDSQAPGVTFSRVVHFSDGPNRPAASLLYEESAAKRLLFRLPRRLLPSFFPRPNTPAFAATRLRSILERLRPDVINVHNLHAAAPWGWDPSLVATCLEFAPVVWTLHDMWAFTGRCAFAYDCEKFIGGCDASCPTPHETPALLPERIRSAWEQRRDVYARHTGDLVVVTPSRWLAEQARRGLFARHRIEVIPYGIASRFNPMALIGVSRGGPGAVSAESPADGSPFVPHSRADARRRLGIAVDGPVLLVAAFDLTERRKGAEILPQLWRHIDQRPLTVLTMGRGTVAVDDPLIHVHPLGYLNDDAQKAFAYAAADALLHAAPADNFPNVVLEALACGTPAIALPVGGLPEMVRDGVSGWLADEPTPAALGQAVNHAFLDLSQGRDLRESCRRLVDEEYSLERAGERYFQLFQQLHRRG